MAASMEEITLTPELAGHFAGPNAFDHIMALQGTIFREMNGRRTLRFSVKGKAYFAKLHFGVGWAEIFKNILQFKIPVLSAENEWTAIQRLDALGIPSTKIAGFGQRSGNPARRQSFLITEELVDTISLEELSRSWLSQPPSPRLKFALIHRVAQIARLMHENGINHRDFYLGHFLLRRTSLQSDPGSAPLELFLIDLHRAQIRAHAPQRWILKDIAGLFFSSMDATLTPRDLFRFMTSYKNKSLRATLLEDRSFWNSVRRQGTALYRKIRHRPPPMFR